MRVLLNHLSLPVLAVITLGVVIGRAPSQEKTGTEEKLNQHAKRLEALEAALGKRDEPKPRSFQASDYFVGYDKGFVIRSNDMKADPFELKINGRMQFRYSGFRADRSTYNNLGTNASGRPLQVKSRSDFEIERGRLVFSGTFIDPGLHFFLNLDADTDDNHTVIFHDFWVNYDVGEDHSIYIGKAFVPGSREWLGGSTTTHLADRSMATTFFRPDRSVGVWAIGKVSEDLHYRAMLGNGFNTTDLTRNQINEDFGYSASLWWEPTGKFGKGFADVKAEDAFRSRFGASYSYAEVGRVTPAGAARAESNFVRLDDGTRINALGVTDFDLQLLAIDAAVKVAGLSIHGEAYYRWLDSIQPNGAPPAGFPFRKNESRGGYLTAGYMLKPNRFELVAMTSTVQGDFKDSWEYGLGVNWYVDGTHKNKLTIDAIDVDGVPTSNSGPNYRMGDDGTRFRIQYQIAF